jgi:hypothetical protein
MASLETDRAMAGHDEFYQALLAAHALLTKAQSDALNARLVLILANHVGDLAVLKAALDLAGEGLPPPAASP